MRTNKLLIVLLTGLASFRVGVAQPRPNIVWIWADNLAYGDVGVYGSDRVETPVIDRLAGEGARFSQYYVAHTVCSPSRAALLTGRQPFRVGVVDVLRPDSPSGLPADEITLAEALRDQGYATQAIGKWHLGDRRQFLPTQNGFDHYFGLPYSMDMLPTVLYRDNEIVDRLDGDKVQDVTIRLTDQAIRFIESNREGPFFLYFSTYHPAPAAQSTEVGAHSRPAHLRRRDRTHGPANRPRDRYSRSAWTARQHARRLHKRQWTHESRRRHGWPSRPHSRFLRRGSPRSLYSPLARKNPY